MEEKTKEQAAAPFDFRQCVTVLKSVGEKAGNLQELRETIGRISGECLFHHTYQYFLKGHIYQYTNDFAQWAGESLEEEALSEQLSSLDPYDCRTMDELRQALLGVIDRYMKAFPEPRGAMPGDEFHFNEAVTIVFPVGIRARNRAEFLMAIKYVDPASIYYHFYEARMRLGGGVDDFSTWIETSLNKQNLGERIRAIDPFMHTLDGIREHIVSLVEEEARHDMEVLET